MIHLMSRCAALALSLALAAPVAGAFEAYRLTDPGYRLALTGDLSDPMWRQAPVFDSFYENMPEDKIPAKFRTEIRLIYDKTHLYVGMKAYDPKPEDIRAPFSRRDKIMADQDFLILYIDAIGTKKAAQFIRVNPSGSVSDGSFTNPANEDFAPDFPFDVATGRFGGGWTAEVRIPLSSIAYPSPQTAPWNLMVARNLLRDQRYFMVSDAMPVQNNCMLCYSAPIKNMSELPTGLNWSATPQLLVRQNAQRVIEHELSLDLKVRPQSGLTIDATINPDFSQLELDAPQLSGNTSFSLFTPEKRPFFLEGADMLRMPLRAVHTRSISAPTWGARLTRRSSDSDVTLLTARDSGGGRVLLPGAYGTGSAAQDFVSQASIVRATGNVGAFSIGALVSDRTLADARGYNRVAGPDLLWQGGVQRVYAQLLSSKTTAQPDAQGRLDAGPATHGHAAHASYSRQSQSWYARGEVEDISADFRDDNGFIAQAGVRHYSAELRRMFGNTGPFNLFNLYTFANHKLDIEGDIIFSGAAMGLYVSGPLASALNVQLRPGQRVRTHNDGELLLRSSLFVNVGISPSRQVAKLMLALDLGEQIDMAASRVGHGGTAEAYAMIRATERLEFEPRYTQSWIDGRDGEAAGQRLFSEQALAMNGIFHISARDSLRLMLQKKRTQRNAGLVDFAVEAETASSTASLVYSHIRSLGSVLYVGMSMSDLHQTSMEQSQRQNEVFVKGSWQI